MLISDQKNLASFIDVDPYEILLKNQQYDYDDSYLDSKASVLHSHLLDSERKVMIPSVKHR